MTTFNLEAAQEAARALLGMSADPREPGYWNTYVTIDAKALAALLDALNIPVTGATPTGASLFDEAQP